MHTFYHRMMHRNPTDGDGNDNALDCAAEKTVSREKSEQNEKVEGAEKIVCPRLVTVYQPTNLRAYRC